MFMKPQIYHGPYTRRETYIEGIRFYPLGDAPKLDSDDEVKSEKTCNGYLVRLSAPGYLDCPEWTGFDNELDALEYLLNELDGSEDEPEYIEIQHRIWKLERQPVIDTLIKTSILSPHRFSRDEYNYTTRSFDEITEASDDESLENFKPDNDGDYAIVNYTDCGDYVGSGDIGAANFRYLRTTYAGFPWVRVYACYGYEAIAIRLRDLVECEEGESILDELKRLERYCLLDEGTQGEIVAEWQDDAWDTWVHSDAQRAIKKRFPDWEIDTIDRIDFEKWANECNEYWITEYNSAYIDVRKIVSKLTDDDIALHLRPRSFSLLCNDVPYGTFYLEYPKTYTLDTLPGIYERELEAILGVWPKQDTLGEWRIVENE